MINLFEQYDQKTSILHKSMKLAGQNHFTTVIEDDGFLPENISSPYQFFANNQQKKNTKGKFFNDIKIPRFWVIEGTNDFALIKDMGEIRGKINYKKNFKKRIVEYVEWYNREGVVRSIDHYTKYGIKFAESVMNAQGKLILKRYFNEEGKEIIYENYITKDIILEWQEKTYMFDSKVSFIIFYLKTLNIDLSQININSLATSFAVLYNLNVDGNDILFWQEHCEGIIPGNMKLILKGNMKRKFKILIPEQNEFEIVNKSIEEKNKDMINQIGYIYEYKKFNSGSNDALIMTNSDQIKNINYIIESNENVIFHIAAVTEMSSKLHSLGRYENVKLYPTIDERTIKNLYKKCDIYLDINEGKEIVNAVQKAFDYNMVILGYREIAHNKSLIPAQHLYPKENNALLLNQALKEITLEKEKRHEYLELQRKFANEIAVDIFKYNLCFNNK